MRASKSFRLHIGIFGRRNAGKSSVLNALTSQEVSIVSEIAGTTTDPVKKPMELLPLGPVLFIDTAGIDDTGALGEQRIRKTISVFDRTELGLIVANFNEWGDFEETILKELKDRDIPVIVVFNKQDLAPTGNSILFARYQGDLQEMVKGAMTIDQLRPGDKILIAEACSHHPIEEDIGTVKIPHWLTRYVGGKLDFSYHRGHDFPDNLSEFKLIIHCGACMWNRREMLSRMMKARM